MTPIQLELPFPPSVNHYWRNFGRTVLSKEAVKFRNTARAMIVSQLAAATPKPRKITWPVAVSMRVHPPDRRRRDLDNMAKAILDALTCGGVWADDRLAHELHLVWGELTRGGKAIIRIAELGELGAGHEA